MKIILVLLCAVALLVFAFYFYFSKKNPTGYFIQNNTVVFGQWMAGDHEVLPTELNSLTWKDLGNDYAKDDKIVVFSARTLPNADVETFERIRVNAAEIQDFYSRDKNALYAGSGIVKGIDPKSAVLLPGEYIKDKNGVFFKYKLIEYADSDSAKVMSKNDTIVLIDKNSAYHFGKKIEDADISTFEIVYDGNYKKDAPYFKDKNHYYGILGEKIKASH